ncbi:MAG: trimethylamine methyltransferase family protein [Planctomycetota bacterium]
MHSIEPIRFLSQGEMRRIHEGAKSVLEKTGVRVGSQRARDYLRDAGCKVDNDSGVVRFPEWHVEECVDRMRRQFADPDRLPNRMSVRYSQVRFTSDELRVHPDFSVSTGGFCCFTTGRDGTKREATMADVRESIRLADRLDAIDYMGLPCSAQDVPAELRPIKMAAELARATTKLGGIETFTTFDVETITKIAEVVAGGPDELRKHPVLVGYAEARSPLCIDENMADILVRYVELGLPQSLDTMPCTATTAPGTLAGTLVSGIAETLAGLCLGYAVDPDAVMTVDIVPSFADHRTLLWDYGSILRGRWLATRVQMISEFYGCPSGVHGLKTNSCFVDAQCGMDKVATTLMPVLAGAIGIGVCGQLENALTFCPEQLVIDAEIARCVRNMLRAAEVSDDTLALDAIGRVGPDGNFLTDPHTLDRIRDEVQPSRLFDCYGWDEGHGESFESPVERARRIAHEHMDAEPNRVLTPGQEDEIAEIVKDAAGRLGVEDPYPW